MIRGNANDCLSQKVFHRVWPFDMTRHAQTSEIILMLDSTSESQIQHFLSDRSLFLPFRFPAREFICFLCRFDVRDGLGISLLLQYGIRRKNHRRRGEKKKVNFAKKSCL